VICPTRQIELIFLKFTLGASGAEHENPPSRKQRFCEAFQRDLGCPVPSLKNISLRASPIKSIFPAIPSHSEGRFAIVTDVGTGCGGRGGGARRATLIRLRENFGGSGTKTAEWFLRKAFADGEVVWS